MKFINLTSLLSFVVLSYAACPPGLSSCGQACYNPSQYSCTNGVLCPAGMQSCGEACYDPAFYHCEGTSLMQGAGSNTGGSTGGETGGNTDGETGGETGGNTGGSTNIPTEGVNDYEGYKLVFADEFDGTSLDRNKWTPEVNCWGGGNAEKQCYVDHPETIFVKDGALHLKAIYMGAYQLHGNDQCTLNNENSCSWTQPFISGRVNTKSNNLAWKYGKVRVRALLPSGPFLWPAIWMLPQDDVYGTWAASGEIDIMEARGQAPDIVSHAIHFGGQWPHNRYEALEITKANAGNNWHVYGLDWEEDSMIFSVDDEPTYVIDLNRNFYSGVGENPYTANRQPFDQSFHMLLNVAVGGGFFNEATYGAFDFVNHSKQWSRPEMAVDYVRVYQKK